ERRPTSHRTMSLFRESSPLTRLLGQKTIDQPAICRRIPVGRAEKLSSDDSVAADDDRFRVASSLIVAADLSILSAWIAEYLESELVMLRELTHQRIRPGIVNAYRYDLEAFRRVRIVQLLDARDLDPARAAPCCPDVDQDNLTAVIVESLSCRSRIESHRDELWRLYAKSNRRDLVGEKIPAGEDYGRDDEQLSCDN